MIRKTVRSSAAAALLILSGLLVAAAPDRSVGAIEGAKLAGILQLEGRVFHVQGVDMDADHIWVTSVDRSARRGYLHEFDRATGRALRSIELTDGVRYHPGGLSVADGAIWVPVAELRPNSSAALLQIDARTLRVRRRIPVADHLGCVAVSGHTLVAGNWDSRRFYIIDLDDPERIRIARNPSPTRYQDLKFDRGRLVASGVRTWWSGTVDWLDWPAMTVTRTLHAGATGPVGMFASGRPLTGEGMAIRGRDLYLVPEDGPSRLFHFRLET